MTSNLKPSSMLVVTILCRRDLDASVGDLEEHRSRFVHIMLYGNVTSKQLQVITDIGV